MVYLLHGPDTFRAEAFLRDMVPEDAEFITLYGDSLDAQALSRAVGSVPMFGAGRWILVRGYPAKGALGALTKLCQQVDDSTVLVFLVGTELKAGDPLVKLARQHGKVHAFPYLRREEGLEWVGERAKLKGLNFEDGALDVLWQAFAGNLLSIETELDKLAAYSGGQMLSRETVALLLGEWSDERLWMLFDAVRKQKQPLALRVLHRLLSQGLDVSQVLAGLSSYLRRVLVAAHMDKVERAELAQTLVALEATAGNTTQIEEWQVRNIVEHASRVPANKLRRQYGQLAAADELVKSSAVPAEVVLDLLVRYLAGGPDSRLEDLLEAYRYG
jgi:DNA polymerase III delta subunit